MSHNFVIKPDGVSKYCAACGEDFPVGYACPYPASLSQGFDKGESVPDRLRRFGVPFSIRDTNYLMDKDTAKYSLLRVCSAEEAVKILHIAKSKIKSATQRFIGIHHHYLIDAPLHTVDGQSKSSLYYAFAESGSVYVAKVYHGFEEEFSREVGTISALGAHPKITSFIDSFSINHGGIIRNIIIMPFFPRSAANLLSQYSKVPALAVSIIARDCFQALRHMHLKQICYADLKPSNIMLKSGEDGAVLIDFGAAVTLGKSVVEYSPAYCLDVDVEIASEILDWTCLAATLAQLMGYDIGEISSRGRLCELVTSEEDALLKDVILACIAPPLSETRIQFAIDALCFKMNI